MGSKIRCIIRGTEYPSFAAAARAFGLSKNAVWIAAERGTLDAVGLGKVEGIPTTVDGQPFDSITAAARGMEADATSLHHYIASRRRRGLPLSFTWRGHAVEVAR